jgi:hypothetical protein
LRRSANRLNIATLLEILKLCSVLFTFVHVCILEMERECILLWHSF